MSRQDWARRRRRLFEIIDVGEHQDRPSRFYDLVNTANIVVNLTVSVMYTFQQLREAWGGTLVLVESCTVAFFTVDYLLRLWTARFLYPAVPEWRAVVKYMFSFSGLVDLLSFLPYYLPVFFPSGAVAFRMFRVVRIFRLFRINAYYDSLNVITQVISSKRQQLTSSVFILLVLMLASSLCMYSLEHEAQPEVFTDAFSGIWWSVSTLLTVGYGDIYPITTLGKVFSILITFLGVGMVAIPTGIISAGFVDQYSRVKRLSDYGGEAEIRFIKVRLSQRDGWSGRTVAQLGLPHGILLAAIQRQGRVVVPRGDVELLSGDTLVLGTEPFRDDQLIELKEMVLLEQHPWTGLRVRELDISRQTIIISVQRKGRVMIPSGDTKLQEGDKLLLYTQKHLPQARSIEI